MNISILVNAGKSGSRLSSCRGIGWPLCRNRSTTIFKSKEPQEYPDSTDSQNYLVLVEMPQDCIILHLRIEHTERIACLSKVDDLAEYLQICGKDSSSHQRWVDCKSLRRAYERTVETAEAESSSLDMISSRLSDDKTLP